MFTAMLSCWLGIIIARHLCGAVAQVILKFQRCPSRLTMDIPFQGEAKLTKTWKCLSL